MSSNEQKSFLDLYGVLKRELGLIFSQELKKYKFGRNQMLIVSYLGRLGPLTSSDLSEFTQADPASTTRTLQALDKLGWIKKVSDPGDQRRTLIELTAKGRKHADDVHQIRKGIEERIRSTLTADEFKQTVQLLSQIIENLQIEKTTGEK